MGLLGGLLLLLGLGFCLLGLVGIAFSLWDLNGMNALYNAGVLVGGLVMGAVATSILE